MNQPTAPECVSIRPDKCCCGREDSGAPGFSLLSLTKLQVLWGGPETGVGSYRLVSLAAISIQGVIRYLYKWGARAEGSRQLDVGTTCFPCYLSNVH